MTQTIAMAAPQETVFRSPLGYLIEFDIDDDITEPSSWKPEIRAIRDAGPADRIHVRLNSGGGRLDTTLEFLAALRQTEAHVTMEITGPIASATTMIFLCGDDFIVNEGVEMMIHQASAGAIGGIRQISDHVAHMEKSCSKLIHEVYEGFCSDEEISDILKGVELWLDAEEIAQRLNKRTEYMQAKNSEIDEKYLTEDKEYLNKLDKDTLIKMLVGEEVELPDEDVLEDVISEEDNLAFFGDYFLDKNTGDVKIPLGDMFTVYCYEMDDIEDLTRAKEFATVAGIEYHKTASKKQMADILGKWVDTELGLEEE